LKAVHALRLGREHAAIDALLADPMDGIGMHTGAGVDNGRVDFQKAAVQMSPRPL
tara:strand:- start:115102 stop:115266 length:165 start_codon:yes stop_codon:yes gene_type:complete